MESYFSRSATKNVLVDGAAIKVRVSCRNNESQEVSEWTPTLNARGMALVCLRLACEFFQLQGKTVLKRESDCSIGTGKKVFCQHLVKLTPGPRSTISQQISHSSAGLSSSSSFHSSCMRRVSSDCYRI